MAIDVPPALQVPPQVRQVLEEFVAAARSAFGESLRSVILFGSAAEGRLRATSDVNLLIVLRAFDPEKAGHLREPLRVAQAAVQLQTMFLLESEIDDAAEAFAQKFDDLLRRHVVLHGDDPLSGLEIPRDAIRERLRQTLLNLILRLRAGYVQRGLREEQLARLLAEASGPLRAAAAALLHLEGGPALSPKQALEKIAAELEEPPATLERISRIRETRMAPAGTAAPAVFRLIDLARAMRERVERLS